MKNKINEWLKRYLPAEIISMILTMVSAELTFVYTENKLTTAIIATVIGNTAYFGCILLTDILATSRQCVINQQAYTSVIFLKNIRALCVEFGIAEVFDTLLVRPFLMYYLPILLNSLPWGTFLAKLIADVTFYIPAIISYEVSKERLRDFQ